MPLAWSTLAYNYCTLILCTLNHLSTNMSRHAQTQHAATAEGERLLYLRRRYQEAIMGSVRHRSDLQWNDAVQADETR